MSKHDNRYDERMAIWEYSKQENSKHELQWLASWCYNEDISGFRGSFKIEYKEQVLDATKSSTVMIKCLGSDHTGGQKVKHFLIIHPWTHRFSFLNLHFIIYQIIGLHEGEMGW